jgi:hypothetical protein
MIALPSLVVPAGSAEVAAWAEMRIHRVASGVMIDLRHSAILNTEFSDHAAR